MQPCTVSIKSRTCRDGYHNTSDKKLCRVHFTVAVWGLKEARAKRRHLLHEITSHAHFLRIWEPCCASKSEILSWCCISWALTNTFCPPRPLLVEWTQWRDLPVVLNTGPLLCFVCPIQLKCSCFILLPVFKASSTCFNCQCTTLNQLWCFCLMRQVSRYLAPVPVRITISQSWSVELSPFFISVLKSNRSWY